MNSTPLHVLDTNHLRELGYHTSLGLLLSQRLAAASADGVTTIISAEEQTKGRLADLARQADPAKQVEAYSDFAETLQFLSNYTLLPWDGQAAERFHAFRKAGVRIGTMDLKIACITIEYEGILLTRNTVDFAKVPGLRFENWLD